jgi:hypothetical protein
VLLRIVRPIGIGGDQHAARGAVLPFSQLRTGGTHDLDRRAALPLEGVRRILKRVLQTCRRKHDNIACAGGSRSDSKGAGKDQQGQCPAKAGGIRSSEVCELLNPPRTDSRRTGKDPGISLRNIAIPIILSTIINQLWINRGAA